MVRATSASFAEPSFQPIVTNSQKIIDAYQNQCCSHYSITKGRKFLVRSYVTAKDQFDRPEHLYLTREKSYVMVDTLRPDYNDQLWMVEELNGLFKGVDIFTDDKQPEQKTD